MRGALAITAGLFSLFSALAWFWSTRTITVEQEVARRERVALRKGGKVDRGGVEILDEDKGYDLIATLRHQGRWSRWGAIFAAIAFLAQAASQVAIASG